VHTQPAAPRHFGPSPVLPGAGLPSDRAAQVAARRAFVLLKASFAEAVAALPGRQGDWLRHQVRASEEPGALWLLRGPVFAALAGGATEHRQRRRLLQRGLEQLFPDSDRQRSDFSPL
jgi:hypothetical protein